MQEMEFTLQIQRCFQTYAVRKVIYQWEFGSEMDNEVQRTPIRFSCRSSLFPPTEIEV